MGKFKKKTKKNTINSKFRRDSCKDLSNKKFYGFLKFIKIVDLNRQVEILYFVMSSNSDLKLNKDNKIW